MKNRIAFRRIANRGGLALCCALGIGASSLMLAGSAIAADKPATAAMISEDQARAVAVKAVPGKVKKVEMEEKEGKVVYVVEVISEQKGEVDVLVDVKSGKVVSIEE